MDDITKTDMGHANAMEKGSAMLLAALNGKRPPGGLMWSNQTSKPMERTDPPTDYQIWREAKDSVARRNRKIRQQIADDARVSRDPCPMCAVRGDLGCGC